MHREIIARNALIINELRSSARNKFGVFFASFSDYYLTIINKYQRWFIRYLHEFEPHLNLVCSIRCFFASDSVA